MSIIIYLSLKTLSFPASPGIQSIMIPFSYWIPGASPRMTAGVLRVRLEAEGKPYQLKTYSPKISEVGFEGDIENCVNQRGDRFVKQVPKAQTGGYARDDAAIRAQWAIGQAINLASATMAKDAITMPTIEKYARQLFSTVSRVKGEPLSSEAQAQGEGYIKQFAQSA